MQKHDKALVGFPQEDRTNVHGSSIYGSSAVLKNQQHSWQRSSPRKPWRPSRPLMGGLLRAAKRPAHHQPQAAFSTTPLTRMPDKSLLNLLCLPSAFLAALPSSRPTH